MADNHGFTEREEKVANLLMEGKSNKQIAAALNISVSTVEFHLTNLYAKMGVASRSEAIVRLSRLGESPARAAGNEQQAMQAPPGEKPGIFPVGNESWKVENKGTSSSPMGDDAPMTPQPNKPSNNNQLGIWIGIVIGLVLFGSYQIFLRFTNHPVEKVQVTRMVTIEATRLVQNEVTRVVTPVPSPEVSLEINLGTPLPVALAHHTITRLPDGKIFIAGGSSGADVHLNAAWIYDPFTNQVYPVASLHTPRHDHSATLLADGRVLIVGGYNLPQQWLTDAEVYDPVANTWTVIPPVYPHGVGHSATRMNDGRVLVVGGCIGSGVCTNRVEIFDPKNNSWTEAAPLKSKRASQTDQLLEDGRVLLAGGDWDEADHPDGNGVIYDPETNRWTATGPMITARVQAESVRMPDGKVLVTGGVLSGGDPPQILRSAEIYDPATNTWNAAADLSISRYAHILALLPNGRAVAIGGAHDYDNAWQSNSFDSPVEMYDPQTNQWDIAGTLTRPTAWAAAVLLPDGRLWYTGGQSGSREYSLEAWFIQLSAH